jgi:gliding motility-associated-like protein
VEWCHIPVYGCNSLIVTSQAILYEGTNVIEIHTTHIPPITGSCPGDSFGSYGQVVQGVRDETGTLEYYPTNRGHNNLPTNWGITGIDNDARRFTPNGQSTYIIDSIPFNPWIIIDSMSSVDLKWYAPGQPNVPFTTGACATVTPDGSQHYYTVSFSGNAGCEQDTVFFIDTVHINYGTAYDTTNVSICQGETYPFFGRHLHESGQYDTLFSSAEGCDSFITLNLTVNPMPDVTIKGSQNVEICEGAATVLALNNPEASSTYQWSKDGAPLPGETSSKITVDEAGSYAVTATTDKGCEATSKTFSLVVHPTPTATINPIDSQVICAYDTLTISAQPGTNYDYRWSPEKPFRQITGPEGQKVTGVFLEPTQVVLTVYNEFGCYDHDTALVATKPCCDVFVPNAFTPNNDGSNDYFQAHLQNGQILLGMQVFDRLGHIVYDNEHPKSGWDGNYQDGQAAPAGTYMYYIQYTCADGKLYHKKESVTLIR